jgi:peptide/nickel transport system permease protein
MSANWAENLWIRALIQVVRSRRGQIGLTILVFMVAVGAFAPWIAPRDPLETNAKDQFTPPSREYLLGTDQMGRCLLSRIIHGTRISISVSLMAVGIGLSTGVVLGLVAGYFGGFVETLIMRFLDALLAIPGVLLAITLVAALGSGLINIIIAIGIANIPRFARISRATMLVEREKEYVLAAKACGARGRYIIFRSILPNCFPPIVVRATIGIATAILMEAGLSFLGVGNPPPSPSWGTTLSMAQRYIYRAPWYGIFPGMAISFLLVGVYLTDDALQRAFRMKEQRFA